MAKPQTIDDLAPNPRNPRNIKPKAGEGLKTSLSKFGDLSGITFNARSGQLVCGHQRLAKLRELGGEYRDGSVWVGSQEFPVRVVDWDEQTEHEANVTANNEAIQGTWDDSIEEYLREIRAGMSETEYVDLCFDDLEERLRIDADSIDKALDGDDNIYIAKVESPVYEPRGDKPPVEDLFDTSKTDQLLERIRATEGLEPHVQAFLEHAAGRHTVFDYEHIAEFYAHAPKDIQALMEESALVIIDFNQAIENGFVKLTESLAEAYRENEA